MNEVVAEAAKVKKVATTKYMCPWCARNFSRRNDVKRHMDGYTRKDRVQRGACEIYNDVVDKATKDKVVIPVRQIKENECLKAEEEVVKEIMSSNNELGNDPNFHP